MRRITSLFLLLCLLSATAVGAWGENPGIAYVSDEVGLLAPLQLQDLEEQAKALAQNEHFEVYIRILEDYSRNGSDSLFEYAIDFYDDNSLGYGKNHDGAMLLLSMADRDYWFDFNGPRSDIAFTETGRDAMEQEVLPYISRGDYYEGFREYLNLCQTYLAAEAEGDPIGYGTDHSETGYIEYGASEPAKGGFSLLFFLPGVIAAIITGIATTVPMRSAKRKTDANGYRAAGGGLKLQIKQDQFLRRTVTRMPKPKPQSTGGSGGSFHGSSGSHSGRGGKF